jgi:hypothetical protein
MNFEGPIPLYPCCKRPSLYRSQHSRTAYKCSYCHAVLQESCIVDWLAVEEEGSGPGIVFVPVNKTAGEEGGTNEPVFSGKE